MKYGKWIAAGVFIATLFLMQNYSVLLQAYGVARTLDMSFGYTSEKVYSMFRQLGSVGIQILTQYFLVDFIFIACFVSVQLSIQHWILGAKLIKTKLKLLNVIPYARGIFDFAENAFFLYLIHKMPEVIKEIVPVMSFITQMKFILIGIWLALLAIVSIARTVAVNRKSKETKTDR